MEGRRYSQEEDEHHGLLGHTHFDHVLERELAARLLLCQRLLLLVHSLLQLLSAQHVSFFLQQRYKIVPANRKTDRENNYIKSIFNLLG